MSELQIKGYFIALETHTPLSCALKHQNGFFRTVPMQNKN